MYCDQASHAVSAPVFSLATIEDEKGLTGNKGREGWVQRIGLSLVSCKSERTSSGDWRRGGGGGDIATTEGTGETMEGDDWGEGGGLREGEKGRVALEAEKRGA